MDVQGGSVRSYTAQTFFKPSIDKILLEEPNKIIMIQSRQKMGLWLRKVLCV
jgi:hypothetical protein